MNQLLRNSDPININLINVVLITMALEKKIDISLMFYFFYLFIFPRETRNTSFFGTI